MSESINEDYGLSRVVGETEAAAPEIDYRPPSPRSLETPIGLIGCGGIGGQQLAAYRHAGFRVVALCDLDESRARRLRDQFYPKAFVTADYRDLLAIDEVRVVDLATHPGERLGLIEAAITAGRHILSQKPFVLDPEVGEQLCDRAEAAGLYLAVNQNGRWAPHFSYLRGVVDAGIIGEVESLAFTIHWDHRWIAGTPFEEIDELILYDFGIHWFDLAASFFRGRRVLSVSATATHARSQRVKPPFLAAATIEFEGGLASLFFNGHVEFGQQDRTHIAGSAGSATSEGPSLSQQQVTLHTAAGLARPLLEATGVRECFQGAMGELLCAIEQHRPPANDARDNLRSLRLCLAALASARSR